MVRLTEQVGPILSGRSIATDVRETIERELADRGQVVVDFEGVEAISPSFADELFAKLPREAVDSGRVQFENLRAEFEAIAKFVIAGRE